MNKLIVALVAFLCFTASAFAEIKFEIIYTDEPGEGFHIRPEARKAVEEAVAEVFSWLDHDADVRIEVKSSSDSDSEFLATAESNDKREIIIPGIYHTHLARKIIFREYENDWGFDAIIEVNFAEESKYTYGDEVSSKNCDFKALITHEMTHALGFTSWIDGADNEDPGNFLEAAYLHYQRLEGEIKNDEYKEMLEKLRDEGVSSDFILLNYNLINSDKETFTYFDTFLVDKQGNKVVDKEKLKFVREDLFKLEDGDPQKCLNFLVKDKEEKVAYSLNRMDASHFEMQTQTVMQHGVSLGPWVRQWSEEEREIMQALGYKLKPAKNGRWVWKSE